MSPAPIAVVVVVVDVVVGDCESVDPVDDDDDDDGVSFPLKSRPTSASTCFVVPPSDVSSCWPDDITCIQVGILSCPLLRCCSSDRDEPTNRWLDRKVGGVKLNVSSTSNAPQTRTKQQHNRTNDAIVEWIEIWWMRVLVVGW